MPTGYTAAVKDGISFEQFVWTCARAFGALVMMRDDALDAKIPDAFQPSPYYGKQLEEASARLAALQAMTSAEATAAAAAAHEKAVKYATERIAEAKALQAKYQALLNRAMVWEAPTPDHESLRTFMVTQLRDSMKFDCSTDDAMPVALDSTTWLAREIAEAARSCEYFARSQAEEIERTAGRNAWLKALRESVPPPGAA